MLSYLECLTKVEVIESLLHHMYCFIRSPCIFNILCVPFDAIPKAVRNKSIERMMQSRVLCFLFYLKQYQQQQFFRQEPVLQ
jgi:hypothetical protein